MHEATHYYSAYKSAKSGTCLSLEATLLRVGNIILKVTNHAFLGVHAILELLPVPYAQGYGQEDNRALGAAECSISPQGHE